MLKYLEICKFSFTFAPLFHIEQHNLIINNMKDVFKSKFKVSQGEMLNNSYSVAYAVERDIDLFSGFNFNSARVNSFKNLLNTYSSFPGDQTLLNAQMEATETKNQSRTDLFDKLRILKVCAGLVYGENTPNYYYFRFDKLRKITDDKIFLVVEQITSEATKRLPVLSAFGYSQSNIDELIAANISFLDSVRNANEKIHERDIATYERTALGNQLFDEFKIMCELGKAIWYHEADAHYNDYIFSESSTSSIDNDEPEIVEEADTGSGSNEIEGNG